MLNPTPSNADHEANAIAGLPCDRHDVSLRSLFEDEESNLLRYAYSLTGRRAVAEEIVQDAFLQLHAHWSSVRDPHAWLYRHVHNRGLNHRRKSKHETLQCDEVHATTGTASDEVAADAAMTREETANQLRQALARLSASDQQLIRLRYFEGQKYREISERTGMSIGNVGFRLHQIMQQLAHHLRPLGIDETK